MTIFELHHTHMLHAGARTREYQCFAREADGDGLPRPVITWPNGPIFKGGGTMPKSDSRAGNTATQPRPFLTPVGGARIDQETGLPGQRSDSQHQLLIEEVERRRLYPYE